MHKRSHICQFARVKLVTYWTNFLKIEVSAISDVARPEKQWIYLPWPYLVQLHLTYIGNYWGVRLFEIHSLSTSSHAISKNVAVCKSDFLLGLFHDALASFTLEWQALTVLMQHKTNTKRGAPGSRWGPYLTGRLGPGGPQSHGDPKILWHMIYHPNLQHFVLKTEQVENTQSSCCNWFFIYRSNHKITHWRSWAKISHSDSKKYVNTC